MNVTFLDPISIIVSSAKLIVEDEGKGTIEFNLFDQPVRLVVDSSDYVYDTEIEIGDRVKLIEPFSGLLANSKGTVKVITPGRTEDIIEVWFDEIFPDQTFDYTEVNVYTSAVSISVNVPIEKIEKI